MYMLYIWYWCTCCTYGTGVHVVLCACRTCCVMGIRYYVCALCSCGIVSCVFIVLYSLYVYVLCHTSSVVVCMYCVLSYTRSRHMYCVVLYTRCRCMYYMVLYAVCGYMCVMH